MLRVEYPSLKSSLNKRYLTIRKQKMVHVLKVQDSILSAIRDFLRKEGFVEILAPIIGPVTDPGIRGARQVSIDYYGSPFKIMSSMILYKQMAITALEKIFAVSPNVRLEPIETVGTRRHLTEFRQVDIEQRNASYEEMMQLAERLLCSVINYVKQKCRGELEELGRKLTVPKNPFERITHREAVELLRSKGFSVNQGEEIPWREEEVLSAIFHEPFFVYDYPVTARGFYDKEDPEKLGILRDFDLMYPEGYGEAASGGEREHTLEKVLRRIRLTGEDPENYGWYLEMLEAGIPPSAGFGIGVERLTKFICGLKNIWEAVPFPKVAGISSP